jgi:RNA polymerase sigma factor (sigma-70 family)
VSKSKHERFKEAYAENFKVARHVLLKFPTLRNDIDDLLHDVFVKFWNHMDTVPPGKERPYLIVSARNAALDRIKQQNFRKTDPSNFDYEGLATPMWESDANHELRIKIVGQLLDEVAAQERDGESFRQFYRDGKTLREIAEQSGEPLGTVAARVSRLRDKLKARLREHLDNLNELN